VRFNIITTQFDAVLDKALARGYDNWFEDIKSDYYRNKKTSRQMMFLE
jgi:hypothetical protein